MPATNTLRFMGFGGGPNGGVITDSSVSDAYQQDYVQCVKDILGEGAFVRIPAVATQATDGSGNYTWSDTQFKRVYDKASALGLRTLVELHYRAVLHTQVPKIFNFNGSQTTVSASEEMTQYKAFVTEVAAKYGPGGTYTPAVTATGWQEPVHYETWNEPNLQGSCWQGFASGAGGGRLARGGNGGFLTAPGVFKLAGYRKAVWLINRDCGDALRAIATTNGWETSLRVIGLVTGALEVDYSGDIIEFAESVGDSLYDYVDDTAHHLYLKTDARTAAAAIRTANGIGTLRSYVNQHGGGNSEFWITEGVYAGSDRWNMYQQYNGGWGVGKAGPPPDGTVVWAGPTDRLQATGAVHPASQLDQATEFGQFIDYLLERNNTSGWGVAAVIPHVVFDQHNPGVGTGAGSGGYTYWQNTRGVAWRIPGDADLGTYTPASGVPLSSPNWKPWAAVFRDKAANMGAPTPPPAPVIDTGPSATTTSTSATFTFHDARGGVTFEASLDGAAFATVTSPKNYAGPLAVGTHQWRIRATDTNGTSSVTTWNWTINSAGTPPPDPVFDTQPGDSSNVTETLAFHDSDGAATFEGRLDGAAYAAVTSPVTLTGLTVGDHQYDLVAVKAGLRSGIVSAAWTTSDPVGPPPPPAFVSGPSSSTTATTGFVFQLADAQPGVTYEYRLDGTTSWTPAATSTVTLPEPGQPPLTIGPHTLEARAVNTEGEAGDPASYDWVIVSLTPGPAPAPRLVWQLGLRDGTVLTGELPAFNRSAQIGVSSDQVVELGIPWEDAAALHFFDPTNVPRLKVYRDGQLKYHGQLWLLSGDAQQPSDSDELSASLTATFKSIEGLYHVTANAKGPIILSGDKYAKLNQLLTQTNNGAGYPTQQAAVYTGVELGDRHGTTRGSDRKWDAAYTSGGVMDEMFARGFQGEYMFRPTEGTKRSVSYPGGARLVEALGEVDVFYPRVGTDSSAVFVFQPGGGNIASISLTRDYHQHVNYSVALAPSLGTTADMRASAPKVLPNALGIYGMVSRVEQASTGSSLDIEAAAWLHGGPGETLTVTPAPNAPKLWDSINVGDTAVFNIEIGATKVSRRYRIWHATLQVSDDGIESLGDITVGDTEDDA